MTTTKITCPLIWLLLYLWFYPMNWSTFTTLGLHLTGHFDPSKDFSFKRWLLQKIAPTKDCSFKRLLQGTVTANSWMKPSTNSMGASVSSSIELMWSVLTATFLKVIPSSMESWSKRIPSSKKGPKYRLIRYRPARLLNESVNWEYQDQDILYLLFGFCKVKLNL